MYAVFVRNTSSSDSAPPTKVCMPVPSGLARGLNTAYQAATSEDHTTIDASGLLMRRNTYDCGQVERQWSQSLDCVLPEASTTGAKPPGLLISRSRPKDEPSVSSSTSSAATSPRSSSLVVVSSTTGISSARYGAMLLRAPKRPDGATDAAQRLQILDAKHESLEHTLGIRFDSRLMVVEDVVSSVESRINTELTGFEEKLDIEFARLEKLEGSMAKKISDSS